MKKNDSVVIEITDMSTTGEGIGRADGYTLFVKGAVIGDTVEAVVTLARASYGFARTRKVIVSSPDRVKPACPKARECGGCTLQALSYEAQLKWKRSLVENSLLRIGGIQTAVEPAVGMDEPFHYRNKSQYPVGTSAEGKRITGFYAGKSHDIIDNRKCLISPENDSVILDTVLDFMDRNGIAAYDEKSGTGLVRHILIRKAFATGEIMVCLILNGRKLPEAERLTAELIKIEGVKSVCLNVNTKRTNVILGEEVIPLYGEPFITDRIGNLSFRISPLSFYQVNPVQTKKLYDAVREAAALTGKETVLDLYCGIGTIGLYLAPDAEKVIGVEIVPAAVKDAKENAERNGIGNAVFYEGAAEEMTADLPKADCIVLDPPRKGCEEKLLTAVLEKAPEKIIYVSCNPSTLARDLKILCAESYRPERVRPFDMFPQSSHVECVTLMSRAKE